MQRYVIRTATTADIPHLARHRAGMFRDMGELAPAQEAPIIQATTEYLGQAMPSGEYLAWVAEADGRVIGGAGVQLRPILPRPGAGRLELGPEAIVLNVFVESQWRRQGAAEALMRSVLEELDRRGISRVVLHAAPDGRRIYERLGFTPTNEMRLTSPRELSP